jgi:ribonucleoside-diphosphate reductase alpha chain
LLNLTPNALKILEKRYLMKEEGRVIENPEDMFKRVASSIAAAEEIFNPAIEENELKKVRDKFYEMMTALDFLPNSPTLMNAGRKLGQLSACFVLPVEDSIDAIFTSVKNAALIHKSGGGTGFSFSRLRPKGDLVRTTGGSASGPVSFMKVFNAATEAIKQGGTRRGANMGILRVDHPDIIEFISCKEKSDELSNFNISIGITDEFMQALAQEREFELRFKGRVYQKLPAKEIFEEVIEHAWANGEPGIVFLDRINKGNPTPKLGEIEATNPCGEQPLLAYEACNLGSINLSGMIKEGEIDWSHLEDVVYWGMRFLDNVIEVNIFPLEEIAELTKGNRKVGLGIMGWADLLFKLRVPYGSEEAVELAKKVMSFIQNKAHEASSLLAEERGNFPNIELSVYKGTKKRNATCTTIAPTGTISMIAGTTSGIEPAFALAYVKNVLEGEKLAEINPVFEEYLKNNFEEEEARRVLDEVTTTGSVQNIENMAPETKKVFVTALEIEPFWHIRMQAAFQAYCDNAVSKTINFPYEATKEDIKNSYLLAYESGCKGVTVYRVKSREKDILSAGHIEDFGSNAEKIFPRPRPKRTVGITEQVKTGCGKMYITINFDQQGIIETFVTTGSTGGCSGFTEGVSRLVSLALRANVAPEAIIDQLTSVTCPNYLRRKATDKTIVGKSCPDIIGRLLQRELNLRKNITDNTEEEHLILEEALKENMRTCNEEKNDYEGEIYASYGESKLLKMGICPECYSPLRSIEGCLSCTCGYSRCS